MPPLSQRVVNVAVPGHLPWEDMGDMDLHIHNVTVDGRRTSLRLEPSFWEALLEISRAEGSTVHEVCTWVAAKRPREVSLTSAVRTFVLVYFRSRAR